MTNVKHTYFAPDDAPTGGAPIQETAAPQPVPQPAPAAVPYVPAPVPPRSKTRPVNGRDRLFFFLTLVGSILTIRATLFDGFGVGFAVAVPLFLLMGLVYVFKRTAKGKFFYGLTAVLLLAVGVSFAFHDSVLVKLCAVLWMGLLFLLCGNGLSASLKPDDGGALLLVDTLRTGVVNIFGHLGLPFASFRAARKEDGRKSGPLLTGLLVAVPLLCVLLPLLSSADAAFKTITDAVFGDVAKVVISVLAGLVVFLFLFSYLFASRKGEASALAPLKPVQGKAAATAVNAFLGAVSFVYLVYLFSQLAYVSAAFKFLLPPEFSAADFARQGFFQMAIIALLNLAVLLTVCAVSQKNEKGRVPASTRALLTFICLFTEFCIAAALLRMAKYIGLYGLTYLRVLTAVFMALLALLFVLFIVRLFVPKFGYVRPAIVLCTLVLLAVSFIDLGSVIAEYNYKEYKAGNISVDMTQMANLATGAEPVLIQMALDKDEPYSLQAAAILVERYEYSADVPVSIFNDNVEPDGLFYLEDSEAELSAIYDGLQTTLPKQRAKAAMRDFLKAYPDLVPERFYEEYNDSVNCERGYDPERKHGPIALTVTEDDNGNENVSSATSFAEWYAQAHGTEQ